MSARILNGNDIAKVIRQEIAKDIESLATKPCLAVVLIGNDAASSIYVRRKQIACEEVGITTRQIILHDYVPSHKLMKVLEDLDGDKSIHGILVQFPLPGHINKFDVFDAISPRKDVDVFTAYNTGLMTQNRHQFQPCTPQACREILVRSGIPIHGQRVAIVNRSLVVGQPLAHMLIQNDDFANATVTICHEHTKNMKEVLLSSDIIVTAVGNRERFTLTADMVRPGATVIDVAIIRQGNKIIGDVDFEEVRKVAGAITPVPNGVGPVTCSMLLKNTVIAMKNQLNC
jgi:methylenetetrahydrofolate dehydrogenase (NADP+)/methenyltetrahydrofolate cyclohydrolase